MNNFTLYLMFYIFISVGPLSFLLSKELCWLGAEVVLVVVVMVLKRNHWEKIQLLLMIQMRTYVKYQVTTLEEKPARIRN